MRILPPHAFRGLAVGRFGRIWRLAVILQPAAPGAPTWSAQPGAGAGQVSWSITAPPTDLGDGPIAGDRAGVLTGYAVEINGVVTTYGTALPRSGTSSGWSSDLPVQIAVWSIGYEGRTSSRLGTVIYPPAPAELGPAAPGWTPIVGPAPGEAGVLIHTAPIDLGDGPIAGDGAGVLTGFVTRIGGVEVTHGPALPVSRTVTGLPATLTLIEVWSLGYGGRRGPVSSAYVTPIAEPESEFAVLIDAVTGAVLIDAVTDRELIDAWPHWPLLGQTAPGVWELLRGRTDAGTYETLLGRAA